VGLAIGRIACFITGCCYGAPTTSPLGMEYRNFALPARPIGVPLHPVQLYEAAGLILIAAMLTVAWRGHPPRQRGRIFLCFLLAYGVLRFLLELLRADPRGRLFGLPTSQFLSVVVIVFAAAALALRSARPPIPAADRQR
jgi:phosphatidylglycerol:prolipoprotein diacylglycerol transferase